MISYITVRDPETPNRSLIVALDDTYPVNYWDGVVHSYVVSPNYSEPNRVRNLLNS